MSASALRAVGLEKRFGPVPALCGVDVELAGGAVVAALGPNGAGKTTLLRILAGLVRPTAGHLELDGARPDRRRARARVGYVGHATLLYPALTARENLLFAARLHGVADAGARADRLLEEAGLAGVAHRRTGGFSRGMAQRLSIARGLVHDPPVVLLDEPYTGLDRAAAARLSARIRTLRDEGRALLVVTHDAARAAEVADIALVLRGGRVVRRAEGGGLTAADVERALEGPAA